MRVEKQYEMRGWQPKGSVGGSRGTGFLGGEARRGRIR